MSSFTRDNLLPLLQQFSAFIFIFTATLLATTAIEPDCDLEQMRAWIERFKEDEEEEVLET